MKIFELEEFEIISIENNELIPVYHLQPVLYKGACSRCNATELHPHSYHTRKIQDVLNDGSRVVLVIHGQRYRCYKCGKIFGEVYQDMDTKARLTRRFRDRIYQDCMYETPIQVAKRYALSITTVKNIFYGRK